MVVCGMLELSYALMDFVISSCVITWKAPSCDTLSDKLASLPAVVRPLTGVGIVGSGVLRLGTSPVHRKSSLWLHGKQVHNNKR